MLISCTSATALEYVIYKCHGEWMNVSDMHSYNGQLRFLKGVNLIDDKNIFIGICINIGRYHKLKQKVKLNWSCRFRLLTWDIYSVQISGGVDHRGSWGHGGPHGTYVCYTILYSLGVMIIFVLKFWPFFIEKRSRRIMLLR